jgi:hypothetical protein
MLKHIFSHIYIFFAILLCWSTLTNMVMSQDKRGVQDLAFLPYQGVINLSSGYKQKNYKINRYFFNTPTEESKNLSHNLFISLDYGITHNISFGIRGEYVLENEIQLSRASRTEANGVEYLEAAFVLRALDQSQDQPLNFDLGLGFAPKLGDNEVPSSIRSGSSSRGYNRLSTFARLNIVMDSFQFLGEGFFEYDFMYSEKNLQSGEINEFQDRFHFGGKLIGQFNISQYFYLNTGFKIRQEGNKNLKNAQVFNNLRYEETFNMQSSVLADFGFLFNESYAISIGYTYDFRKTGTRRVPTGAFAASINEYRQEIDGQVMQVQFRASF